MRTIGVLLAALALVGVAFAARTATVTVRDESLTPRVSASTQAAASPGGTQAPGRTGSRAKAARSQPSRSHRAPARPSASRGLVRTATPSTALRCGIVYVGVPLGPGCSVGRNGAAARGRRSTPTTSSSEDRSRTLATSTTTQVAAMRDLDAQLHVELDVHELQVQGGQRGRQGHRRKRHGRPLLPLDREREPDVELAQPPAYPGSAGRRLRRSVGPAASAQCSRLRPATSLRRTSSCTFRSQAVGTRAPRSRRLQRPGPAHRTDDAVQAGRRDRCRLERHAADPLASTATPAASATPPAHS